MYISLTKLNSVFSREVLEALDNLGIFTVRDMAEFTPCRHAEIVLHLARKKDLSDAEFARYFNSDITIDTGYRGKVAKASADDLKVLTLAEAEILKATFEVGSIHELSMLPPYVEARAEMRKQVRGAFFEKSSAPEALQPDLIGSTHTIARFSSFVRDREFNLSGYRLQLHFDSDEPKPHKLLAELFLQSSLKGHFGYLAGFVQKWVNTGTSLGEPVYSVALAPGESRNVAIVDWYRRQSASRGEETNASEVLQNELIQTRALNEVVQTTAREHQFGETEIKSSNSTSGEAKTSGFGASKGSAVSGNADLSATGYPIQVGAASNLGVAGSTGSSKVESNSRVVGTLAAETSGERSITAEVMQNISDRTTQNSSNMRSLMSTVVINDEQSGTQRTETRNITNYNHSHALTMQYFEVLQSYRISTEVKQLHPLCYLPFRPLNFNMLIIQNFWEQLKTGAAAKLPRKKFRQFRQVITDFDPANGAFDATNSLRVQSVNISRFRTWSSSVRVKLDKANHVVTLAIDGNDLRDSLEFRLTAGATHVAYEILRFAAHNQNTFGNADSFVLGNVLNAEMRISFETELRSAMRRYLNDSSITPKVWEVNREDNELDQRNNRPNLVHDVDNGDFSLLNGNERLDVTIDMNVVLVDTNGELEEVNQTLNFSQSFEDLRSASVANLGNVATGLNDRLMSEADFNPTQVVDEIIDHFKANRYFYTKHLLATMEKAQFVDIIENLGISDGAGAQPLTRLVDPSPIAITENLIVFKLREPKFSSGLSLSRQFWISLYSTAEKVTFQGTCMRYEMVRNGVQYALYKGLLWANKKKTGKGKSFHLTLGVDITSDGPEQAVRGRMVTQAGKTGVTETHVRGFEGVLKGAKSSDRPTGELSIRFDGDQKTEVAYTVKSSKGSATESAPLKTAVDDFLRLLNAKEEKLRNMPVSTEAFLPTSGVFGEAILGKSNASEFIDIRRFYNWQDSPIPNMAPGVSDVDATQNFFNEVPAGLQPTVPISVLNQMSPQPFPETSLGQALGAVQNGNMFRDMSGTTQLVSVLGNLAELAKTTAQQAGSLSGRAQESTLNGAVEMGRQVASMLEKANSQPPARPATTPTDVGGQQNQTEIIAKEPLPDGKISKLDEQRIRGVGGDVDTSSENTGLSNYAYTVSLLDEYDVAYSETRIKVTLVYPEFEDAPNDWLNAGDWMDMKDGLYVAIGSRPATPGRLAHIIVKIEILGDANFNTVMLPFELPDDKVDLHFTIRMGSKNEQVVATSVKRAIDSVVSSSGWNFGMDTLFKLHMDQQVELPFKISGTGSVPLFGEVGLEGGTDLTAGGGVEPQLGFRGAYNWSTVNEAGTDNTDTIQRSYDVTFPSGRFLMTGPL